MDMALTIPLIGALFGMGALTGVLAGLLGIGGGIILLPSLWYLFRIFKTVPADQGARNG